MENEQMCDLSYGKVISISPLKVQITNLLTLPQSVLIVPQHLTDYTVDITVDWNTESDTHNHQATNQDGTQVSVLDDTHSHKVVGKKQVTIHNALKVGDKVALIRKTGGQSYFILDRV